MRGEKWGSVCLRGIRGSRLMARHLDPDLLLTPGAVVQFMAHQRRPYKANTHLDAGGRVRGPRVDHGLTSSVQGGGREVGGEAVVAVHQTALSPCSSGARFSACLPAICRFDRAPQPYPLCRLS